SSEISESVNFCVMEAIKLCRLDTPIIFIEARINLSRFVVTGCAAKTSAHDVISSFGAKTSYDADNRSLLVMRSNIWASGYDVDGTDQTSLGQFSGRVQQTYKHSVPRFFVPEHGTMFTLALVRFPPTATKEIQYLN